MRTIGTICAVFLLAHLVACSEQEEEGTNPNSTIASTIVSDPPFEVTVDGETVRKWPSSMKVSYFSDGTKSIHWGLNVDLRAYRVSLSLREDSLSLLETRKLVAKSDNRAKIQLNRYDPANPETFERLTDGTITIELRGPLNDRKIEVVGHTENADIDMSMQGPVGVSCNVPAQDVPGVTTLTPEDGSTFDREVLVTDQEFVSEQCKSLRAMLE